MRVQGPGEQVLLSILVPAYNYLEGVKRLERLFSCVDSFPVEIFVFDDSSNDDVEQYLAAISKKSKSIFYVRNVPANGAVTNWNALLDAARGEYVWLLHHDEFPMGLHFMEQVMARLQGSEQLDLLLMDCVLNFDGRLRRHVPTFLRKWVCQSLPSYLFKRNVIGPTSCLIVKRELYPRFDLALRWLVDVSLYYELFSKKIAWRYCPELKIGSIAQRANSITGTLGDEVARLRREERAFLVKRYPAARCWLDIKRHGLLNGIEWGFWNVMRVVTLFYARLVVLTASIFKNNLKVRK